MHERFKSRLKSLCNGRNFLLSSGFSLFLLIGFPLNLIYIYWALSMRNFFPVINGIFSSSVDRFLFSMGFYFSFSMANILIQSFVSQLSQSAEIAPSIVIYHDSIVNSFRIAVVHFL